MVKYSAAALNATFGALADGTRRAILARLALGETSVSEVAAPYVRWAPHRGTTAGGSGPAPGNLVRAQHRESKSRQDAGGTKAPRMSLVAVMKHLRVLEGAGLVRTEKDGRVRRCQLSPQPLREAAEWIRFYQKFWEEQFDALEKYIEEVQKEDPSWRPQPVAPAPGSTSGGRSARLGKKSSRHGSSRSGLPSGSGGHFRKP
jgi:DNA-binding transcriptional ArsR family regulator